MEQEESHLRERVKDLEQQLSEKAQKETKLQTELTTQIEHYRHKSMAVHIEKDALLGEAQTNFKEEKKLIIIKHEGEVKDLRYHSSLRFLFFFFYLVSVCVCVCVCWLEKKI